MFGVKTMWWARLLLLISCCSASRILVVFPVPSHSSQGDSVVRTLLTAGHEVTYVTPFLRKVSHENLTHVDISSIATELSEFSKVDLTRVPLGPRSVLDSLRLGTRVASRTLQHRAVVELISDPGLQFDAVIADWYYSGLFAPLSDLFECPLIWYSAEDLFSATLRLVHEAPSLALSCDPHAPWSGNLPHTVSARARLLWHHAYSAVLSRLYTDFVELTHYESIYRTPMQLRKRILPNFEESVHSGSLLVNSRPPLGLPLPVPRNVKLVGGHHLGSPITPLNKNLLSYLEAKGGVIYMDLGHGVRAKDLQQPMARRLLDMLGELEQLVLWRLEGSFNHRPDNVHLLLRAPQFSILNHPNVMMFITAGSMPDLLEATASGVPVIGVPMAGDQFLNVELVQARHCGLKVDFDHRHFAWMLQGAIREILGNYSYKHNAMEASRMFKQSPISAKEELVHWVELVVSTGGASHLRSPALLLPAQERYHLDLWFLFLLLIWFFSKVLKVIKVHLKDYDELDKKNK